jgi:hypothetical protein
MGAMSTLYNAIRMKIPVSSTLNQKIIVTEGITDFYFWKMLTKDLVILPGFGAGQNEYLISIAIGTSKKYLAFFDGDVTGEQAIQKYTRFFNTEEAKNWKKYMTTANQEVELEKLLSANDQARLTALVGMKDLKKGITALFFSPQAGRYWRKIDPETLGNLKKNIVTLKSQLDLVEENFYYDLGK